MSAFLFAAIFFLNLYWTRTKPGAVLAYIIFFQSFNKFLFDGIGLTQYRYSSTFIFLLLIMLFHYRKDRFNANFASFINLRITWAYVLVVVYMMLYAFTTGTHYAMDYFMSFITPGLVLIFISGTFFFKDKMFKEFLHGFMTFSTILFISILSLHGLDVFLMDRGMIGEVLGFGPIGLGRLAALQFVLALILLTERKMPKPLGVFLLLFFAFVMGFAGTRGALVSGVIAYFIYLFLTKGLKGLQNTLKYAVIIVPVLLYLGFANLTIVERTQWLFEQDYIQTMRRYTRVEVFFDVIPDYFVFGVGPGGWGQHIMPGDVYPHNLIMELIILFGIAGFIALTLILKSGYIITKSLNNNSTSLYIKLLTVCWVFYFVASMFSGSLVHNSGVFYFLIIVLQWHSLSKAKMFIKTKAQS